MGSRWVSCSCPQMLLASPPWKSSAGFLGVLWEALLRVLEVVPCHFTAWEGALASPHGKEVPGQGCRSHHEATLTVPGNFRDEVLRGRAQFDFWAKEKSQVASPPLGSWLDEAGSQGPSPGMSLREGPRQAEVGGCRRCSGWGGESCELTSHWLIPVGSLLRSRIPRFHLRFLPWPPTAGWRVVVTERCGRAVAKEIVHGVTCSAPQACRKQDKGMGTDGLREGAARSLLCIASLVSQSFPLCREKGLLAGWLTPESTPPAVGMVLPGRPASPARSKHVLRCSRPHSAGQGWRLGFLQAGWRVPASSVVGVWWGLPELSEHLEEAPPTGLPPSSSSSD